MSGPAQVKENEMVEEVRARTVPSEAETFRRFAMEEKWRYSEGGNCWTTDVGSMPPPDIWVVIQGESDGQFTPTVFVEETVLSKEWPTYPTIKQAKRAAWRCVRDYVLSRYVQSSVGTIGTEDDYGP